jgi:hypothetical protein
MKWTGISRRASWSAAEARVVLTGKRHKDCRTDVRANTSVLHNNDRAMTGNLDSKIISIDSYLQVEMAGKFSTFMYLFLCTSSMTIGSLIGTSVKAK